MEGTEQQGRLLEKTCIIKTTNPSLPRGRRGENRASCGLGVPRHRKGRQENGWWPPSSPKEATGRTDFLGPVFYCLLGWRMGEASLAPLFPDQQLHRECASVHQPRTVGETEEPRCQTPRFGFSLGSVLCPNFPMSWVESKVFGSRDE